MANLTVETLRDERTTTLQVQGEVDLATVPILEDAVAKARSDGARRLVLDLAKVSFMDSTGLRVLVGTDAKMRDEGGEMLIGATSEPVGKLLDVSGLRAVFRYA